MGRATYIPITGAVLEWARKAAGLTQNELAARIKADASDISEWEAEEAEPTKTQFSRLVEVLRRPSAIFFSASPPANETVRAAFRRASKASARVSPDELLPLRVAKRYQDIAEWIASMRPPEHLTELPQVEDTDATQPSTIARDLRQRLGLTFKEQLAASDPSEALKAWRKAVEDQLGVYVFQMQFPPEAKATRGFSIPSATAPVVVLNSAFVEQARIFTLFHECAHLILNDAIICDVWLTSSTRSPHERWAESFAACVLLPAPEFRPLAVAAKGDKRHLSVPDIRTLARRTKVSARAVALRSIELRLASWDLYDDLVKETKELDFKEKGGGGGGGETTPHRRLRELGPRLPQALFSARDDDLIGHYDLLKFLDMSTEQANELEHAMATRQA